MAENRMAVVGVGATGSVLAAALLSKYPETVLVGRRPDLAKARKEKSITISGAMDYRVQVKNCCSNIGELKDLSPTIIFLCTKTFHLADVLEKLQDVVVPGTKIICTQNGLGPEDLIADKFGEETVFRMSLNYGAVITNHGETETAFFNRPNHLGCLSLENRELGLQIAGMLNDCDLDTEFVDDIKMFVWKKMIMKCTMASICAVTNKTIKAALEYPPTREIADTCFKEALAVAKAMGYDLGEDYLKKALSYLEKVGGHKDSMCFDIENETPTEIDFLGAKIVGYARERSVPTPFYVTMTNLVKAIEDNYLVK
ncbi:MAG: 2-dehydropantoate 2-reductase [Deltaproteobacteria bacterium]|jgi:2-dehydropantoate 2-reductase|nr:2-dehydropantoate 2-reductase [Deltaproteobacteria bacterium]